LLYYIIIAPFRKILHDFMCIFSRSRRRMKGPVHLSVEVSTKENYRLVLLHSLKKNSAPEVNSNYQNFYL
jgi:hypothetical protein